MNTVGGSQSWCFTPQALYKFRKFNLEDKWSDCFEELSSRSLTELLVIIFLYLAFGSTHHSKFSFDFEMKMFTVEAFDTRALNLFQIKIRGLFGNCKIWSISGSNFLLIPELPFLIKWWREACHVTLTHRSLIWVPVFHPELPGEVIDPGLGTSSSSSTSPLQLHATPHPSSSPQLKEEVVMSGMIRTAGVVRATLLSGLLEISEVSGEPTVETANLSAVCPFNLGAPSAALTQTSVC